MTTARRTNPIDRVVWVGRDAIEPNTYNPNHQPPPEHELLRISLLEDGWTQPIVVFAGGDPPNQRSGPKPIIVDGEHRWRLSADPQIFARDQGMVPVVYLDGDAQHLMMSTIRHNRARGEHGVGPMAGIVRHLLENGQPEDRICRLLQMEPEEVRRLADRAGMPIRGARGAQEFNNGWVPGGEQPGS